MQEYNTGRAQAAAAGAQPTHRLITSPYVKYCGKCHASTHARPKCFKYANCVLSCHLQQVRGTRLFSAYYLTSVLQSWLSAEKKPSAFNIRPVIIPCSEVVRLLLLQARYTVARSAPFGITSTHASPVLRWRCVPAGSAHIPHHLTGRHVAGWLHMPPHSSSHASAQCCSCAMRVRSSLTGAWHSSSTATAHMPSAKAPLMCSHPATGLLMTASHRQQPPHHVGANSLMRLRKQPPLYSWYNFVPLPKKQSQR